MTGLRIRASGLLPVLGVGFGLAVTIGNAIGAGILRAPGEVAGHLPVAWLFMAVWVVGGLYALLGALQLAELGAMIPRSGGQYVFSRYALGRISGLHRRMERLDFDLWHDGSRRDWSSASSRSRCSRRLAGRATAIAAAVVVVFAARAVARASAGAAAIQNVTSLLKTLAFRGAWQSRPSPIGDDAASPSRRAHAAGGLALLAAFVLSLQSVIYTYDGWSATIYFCEEVENPGRDIPRSMIGGVLSVIAIYLLVNLALLAVLSGVQIAGSSPSPRARWLA